MEDLRRRLTAARDNFHLGVIRYLLENFSKLIIPKSGAEGQLMRKRWREDLGAYVDRNIGRSVASGIQLFSWGVFLRKLEEAVASDVNVTRCGAMICGRLTAVFW